MSVLTTFLIITLLISISETKSDEYGQYRTIKLTDFVENGSYLPVLKGERFIIEVEGNPNTGYKWYLANAEVVERGKILAPLNLDERGSGYYYNSHKKEEKLNGLYHFLFEAKTQGNEKLTFAHYKDQKSKYQKTIEVHVKDLKRDL